MANFGPLTAEIGWRVWDTPANFNGFRVLGSFSDLRLRRELERITVIEFRVNDEGSNGASW